MRFNTKNLGLLISTILLLAIMANGQDSGNGASADSQLRGSGRVNSSTLGMEIDIPLGNYSGRGINMPINLSYSSKVWRPKYKSTHPMLLGSTCFPFYDMEFAEDNASGWTTSTEVPFIEYIGRDTAFDNNGLPVSHNQVCEGDPPEPETAYFIKRILVHLPSGETHEMRVDDNAESFDFSSQTPVGPDDPDEWDETYYAVDGSNLKYIQDPNTTTYQLQMPDGSRYDFSASEVTWNDKSIRRAATFTDRNGNFTEYHEPTETYPNGYWTDTLGRIISLPVGLSAPDEPTSETTPQTYSLPGMGETYKLHWKHLKGSSAAESGLVDFDLDLKYPGDWYNCLDTNQHPIYCHHDVDDRLFDAGVDARIVTDTLFNPIVLTKIELPTGESYQFKYDIYGRIERIIYPTGGEEEFTYGEIPTLSILGARDITGRMSNFGVTSRRVLKSANDPYPYEWFYSADYEEPGGYVVRIENPDGTKHERFLHRGDPACESCTTGNFGFDNGLAGMAYKEITYDSAETMISQTLTSWKKDEMTIGTIYSTKKADWNPRVMQSESIVYEPSGNGDAVSSTTKYEYLGDLSVRGNPVLMNKTTQYAFEAAEGSSPIAPIGGPGEDPEPYPTPIPTPIPSTPVKITETTYLIADSNYSSVKSYYTDQNMIGLVTAAQVKDGAGTVVSRSEMVYDDNSNYPLTTPQSPLSHWAPPANGYRGNPHTVKVWDSTKGIVTNSSAYIATHAQFDNYGNQIKAWDALGNFSTTSYDSTYYAYPTSATSAAPDSSGYKGSSSGFTTTATFNTVTGLPLTTTDANGLKTEITYDSDTLRLLNTKNYIGTSQVGGTSETIYHDESGNFWVKNRSQIDDTNWAESITYFDGLGRAYKVEKADTGGNIFVEKEFDADGRVYRVTNPYRADETKQWTTNVYDDASRVKEVILPDGAKVKTDYAVSITDKVGISKQITDQAGKKRKGITDSLGRMIRVIEDPAGQNLNTDYVFDTLGSLRKMIQGEQSRYFMHDSLGRLLYAKQPEQEANTSFTASDPITSNTAWSVKYEYDDNGNILKTTDAEGVYVQGTYDSLNRITVRDYSDSTPDVEFYYDGTGLPAVPDYSIGKTTKVTSSLSETRYKTFDEFGRLLTHEQRTTPGQLAGTEDPYDTAYEYNLSGALIEETYPSGRKVKNVLDNDGALSIVQSKKDSSHGYWNYAGNITYNTVGAVEKMRLGNGRWETATYNNRQQITQIGLGETDDDQDLLNLEYDYGTNTENNGSLREQTITVPTVGSTSGFTAVQDYAYDDLNRLQSAEETVSSSTTWKQTFTYDRYGNRKFDTTSGLTTTLGSCTETVCNPDVSTATNRFTTSGYTYDKNGNLAADAEGKRYSYDAENHQKEYFSETNSTSTPDATYFYDGEGKRIKKINNLETTIFVYDAGGQLVAEYSTQTAQTPRVSYLTTDHLGSPRIITDENGEVVERKDYTAFGEESISEDRQSDLGYSGVDETRKGYTGYEKDAESGLDFAQARYYNSGHGRYTSIDPLTASASIRNPQTFNRYSYVLNSPYKFTDPLGLLPSSPDYATGTCSAERSSCDSEPDSPGDYTEASWDSETEDTDTGVAANHEVSHATSQEAEAAQAPPLPTQDDPEWLVQLRSTLPVFNSEDGAIVNAAIVDAQNSATSMSALSAISTTKFRNKGDTTTPSLALATMVASNSSSINVIGGNDGTVEVNDNAMFDGRTSTMLIDGDGNPDTPLITISQFFKENKTVNAITVGIERRIFLGPGFFKQDRDGKAKSVFHEAVVHKGFKRSDIDFGSTRVEGSRAINSVIDKFYIRRRESVVTSP